MKTKQEMRDELLRITDTLYYFKDHPLHTGAMLRDTSKSFTEISDKNRHTLHIAVVEMGEYIYRYISGDATPGVYEGIFELVSKEVEPLLTYELVPITYDDETEKVTWEGIVAWVHVDTMYDIVYKYSRVAIIDELLEQLP